MSDTIETPSCTRCRVRALRAKTLLLVLDHCEHLIEACATLADTMLRACPNLRILVTSRQAPGITGEVTFLVPALSLSRPGHRPAGPISSSDPETVSEAIPTASDCPADPTRSGS